MVSFLRFFSLLDKNIDWIVKGWYWSVSFLCYGLVMSEKIEKLVCPLRSLVAYHYSLVWRMSWAATRIGFQVESAELRLSWPEKIFWCTALWRTFWMGMKQGNEQDNRCTWVLSLGESSEMFNILQKSKHFLRHLNLCLLLYVFLLISSYIFEKLPKVQMPVGGQFRDTYFGCLKSKIITKNAIYIHRNNKCRF